MHNSVILHVDGEVFHEKYWHNGSLYFSKSNCGMACVLEVYLRSCPNIPSLVKQFTPSQLTKVPPRERNYEFGKALFFVFHDRTIIRIRSIVNMESQSGLVHFLNDFRDSAKVNSFSRMRNGHGNLPYARPSYGQQQFAASRRNNYMARRSILKSPSGHRMNQGSHSYQYPRNSQDFTLEIVDDRSKPSDFNHSSYFSSRENKVFTENRTPLKMLNSNANHDHSKRPKQLDLDSSKRPKLSSDVVIERKEGGQLGGQLMKDHAPQKLLSEREHNSYLVEPSPYTGFPNIGNSCFMNSVLQSLLQLRCISDDLDSTRQALEKSLPEQSIIRCLLSLLSCPPEECQKLLGQTLEVIANSSPCFADGQQHDALEFLVQLLDVIKEEVKKASGGCAATDPVTNNIEFQLSSSYMCQKCNKIISKKEVLHMLSLNVPSTESSEQPSNLSDALKDYFEPQEIEMKCEHCSGTSTKCVQGFSTVPRVLVFHLKRYTYMDGTCKIMCPVQVPIHLSLEEFITDQSFSFDQSILSHPSPSIAMSSEEESLTLSSSSESPVLTSPDSNPEKNLVSSPLPVRTPVKLNKCSVPGRKVLSGLHPSNSKVPIALKGGSDSAKTSSPIPAIGSDVPVEKSDVNIMETISEETEEEQFEKVLKLSRESAQCQEDKELIEAMNRSVQDISPHFLEEYDVYQEEPSSSLKDTSDVENISGPFSYQLASVVSHIGHNADTGHYVANYFDSQSGQWWHFNDEVVHRKSKHSVLESIKTQGYLFFYVAKATPN